MTLDERLRNLRAAVESESADNITREQALELLDLLDALQRGQERASSTQAGLEDRLRAVENSVVFRTLRSVGGEAQTLKRKVGHRLLHSPLHPLAAKVFGWEGQDKLGYRRWIARKESTGTSADLAYRPLISILTPVFNPRLDWLQAAIDSVARQSYREIKHCLAVDGQPSEELRHILEASGVSWTSTPEQKGISSALNKAGEFAQGGYIAVLDQDDLLAPDAMLHVAAALQDDPADIVYSDEDYIDTEGNRRRPNLKPDWSPELLDVCMYFGHLFVVKRELIDRSGWFDSTYDGAQDYDLALRLAELNPVVRHIPKVLYHWRSHSQSTAATASAKPYAQEAGRKALGASLNRRKEAFAGIDDGAIAHTYIARRGSSSQITFIVCSRDAALLRRCVSSLPPNCNLVVVHHRQGDGDPAMLELLPGLKCSVITYSDAFNFASMNNLGAAEAAAEHLVFLNDDVVALHEGWTEAMSAHLDREEVGVVGVKLIYPSGALQHAGIALGIGEGVGHIGRGLFRSDLWPWLELRRDVSAVTGACLGIRRDLFNRLGGFDAKFPVNFNDVDLCLRVREAGFRVICDPAIELRHDECGSRSPGTRVQERELFYERWGRLLSRADPFYHPELQRAEEIALAT